jgi:DNA replication protein DnaC
MKEFNPGEQPTKQRQCDDHGEYTSTNYIGSIWSRCPECSKLDALKREEESEARAKEDAAIRLRNRIVNTQIPPRFLDRALESYIPADEQQEKALSICTAYANDFDHVLENGSSLIFSGKPGTGKTHLAAGIGLKVAKDYRKDVLFSTVMRVVRRIKDTWGRKDAGVYRESEGEAIAAFAGVDLLILDEVGVQFGSETEENFLFDIINERYENRRPTIIISNLDIEGIKQYLGERAFDRLREDGGKYIPFTWDSYRGTKNQETNVESEK